MIVVYVIAGILVLFFALAAILPGDYKIEKHIVIHAPADKIYEKVANLNNYRDWNPWQKMEPQSKSEITGTPGLTGHRFYWEGKKIGIGSLTVKSAVQPSSVQLDLEFIKPFASKANDNWRFDGNGSSTSVTWQNSGKLPYPTGRLMGVMIRKTLNTQFEQGLKNLKEMCER